MLKVGDIFAEKYKIIELLPDIGGMGRVLFVTLFDSSEKLALKFCKKSILYKRFSREVKILESYRNNSKVIQIIAYDLEYDPPYFVMPFAEKGDLYSKIDEIKGDPKLQEAVFYRMIDAVAELHLNGDIHRDIKPQNFLVMSGERIVVSDFGLAKGVQVGTVFTNTLDQGGTEEYAPPEYYIQGGFKNATFAWDIFSLGKSFYRLITGYHAQYLSPHDIPPSVYHVIKKCTATKIEERFQNLSQLRQAIKNAYDIVLKRMDSYTEFEILLDKIRTRIIEGQEYVSDEINQLFLVIPELDENAQLNFIEKLPEPILKIICEDATLVNHLEVFLELYKKMLEKKRTQAMSFSYAETVAKEMGIVFNSSIAQNETKALALDIAIFMAIVCNRFAAMDSCAGMIKSARDEELGMLIAELMDKYNEPFIRNIEPVTCNSMAVRNKLAELRKETREDLF